MNPKNKKFHRFWVGTWIFIILTAVVVGFFSGGVYHSQKVNNGAQEIINELNSFKIENNVPLLTKEELKGMGYEGIGPKQ